MKPSKESGTEKPELAGNEVDYARETLKGLEPMCLTLGRPNHAVQSFLNGIGYADAVILASSMCHAFAFAESSIYFHIPLVIYNSFSYNQIVSHTDNSVEEA